jgi:2-octaprenyl-6-methoxyphenol hydroxylase
MGNAMHTVHPIAGQGLNLGLRDVEYFLALLDERKANDDLGQIELLLAFQHARKGDIKRTVMMTDGLVRAYSNNFLPMIIGRNIGLSLMHFVSEIKMPLAKQALGWWRE